MNRVKEIKETIRQAVGEALARAAADQRLPDVPPPAFSIDTPRDKKHGDFAVNIAMIMSKQVKMPPREIAEIIIQYLERDTGWLEKTEIAGAGFINFFLVFDYFHPVIDAILREGPSFGHSDFGGGRKVQIEFVSANPTGLLHMGNARGAALGDSLASIMGAAGYSVSREYFINDAGNQVENFGKSLEVRYLELLGEKVDFPEEGYHGEDIIDTAKEILAREGDRFLRADPALRRAWMIRAGLEEKLKYIRQSLEDFGVRYDVWFSEKSLHESGKIEETVRLLRDRGLVYEKDGALWLKTSAFGDEKDEVMVKATGAPTYFGGDIAYHRDKLERGFTTVIDIWGADHHGHVARMKGAMEAFGYDPGRLEVILYQLVRLLRGKEVVRMSKRSGQYITLDELVEEVGRDAARFFFVMRSADSQMDFDLDLAKSQSSENPVYYVQYAHARIHSLLKMAKAVDPSLGGAGMQEAGGPTGGTAHGAAGPSGAGGQEEGDPTGGTTHEATGPSGAGMQEAGGYTSGTTHGATGPSEAGGQEAGAGAPRLWPGADLRRLAHPAERELIRKLADLPEEIVQAAVDREPHRLPRYAMDLAALYHSFYTECRCLVDEMPLRQARLQLCDAARVVLRNTLELIGVSAPERM